jgi:O-antigen/teichoic acid export membrane protein
LLPHLSHDWEAGRTTVVSARINLAIKLLGLAMFAASALVLLAAPLLFGVALEGKYAGGQQILPWTLAYCVWMALVPMAQMYLWCAERARLPAFALVAGLIVNVLLCRWLLPLYGLPGVAWATATANFVGLTLIYACNRLLGMHIDRGTWLVTLLPALLGFGPWVALAAAGVVALEIATGQRLLRREEKEQIRTVYRHYVASRILRNRST